MKLHLPSSLRKALMACLAVFTLPTLSVSVGSGALAASALVSFYAASSSVQAAPDNPSGYVPAGEWGNETVYNEEETSVSGEGEVNMTVRLRLPGCGDVDWAPEAGSANLSFGAHSGNLKIVVENADATSKINLSEQSRLNSTNIWFAGANQSNNCIGIGSNEIITSSVRDIHVTDVQLYFGNSSPYSEAEGHKLNANFHLGGNQSFAAGLTVLHGAALRLGSSVETTGYLEVMEDTGIALTGGSGVNFLTDGALRGSGTLTLGLQNYTWDSSYIFMGGSVDDCDIKLNLWNGADVKIGGGQTLTLSGLMASDNGDSDISVVPVEDNTTANLVLNVASGQTVTFNMGAGGGAGATGLLRLQAGVSLTKQGTGTQVFASGLSAVEQVSVEAGMLSFTGGNVTLTGGLNVTGGKVEVSTTGAKNFGKISLVAGTELVVKTDAWSNSTSSVVGTGTVVVDGVTANTNANGMVLHLLPALAGGNTEATSENSLKRLDIRNGGRLTITTNVGDYKSHFRGVDEIHVAAGSNLWLGANQVLNERHRAGQTLYLSGAGSGTADAEGALHVRGGDANVVFDLPWNIVLDGDTTIVRERTVNFTGAFDTGANRTLIWKGNDGKWNFNNASSISGSGVWQIDGGRVYLNLTNTEANRVVMQNYGLRLNGSTAQFLIQLDTTLAWLEGGAGEVVSGTSQGLTLTLESNGAAHDASFEIKHGYTDPAAAAANTRLHLIKKGSYSQSIGSYHAGELQVLDGTLHVKGDLNNFSSVTNMQSSVTVSNATLQVDAGMRTKDANLTHATVQIGEGYSTVNGTLTISENSTVTVGAATAGVAETSLTVNGAFQLTDSTLTVHGNLISGASEMLAARSTLTVDSFSAQNLTLQASRMNISKSVTSVSTNVSMTEASSIWFTGTGNATQSVALGTLRVNGAGNSIHWSSALAGGQAMSAACLTGEGDLVVDAITHVTAADYQRFMVNSVVDFNGTLTSSVAGSAPGSHGTFGFFIGEVMQSTGMSLDVKVDGYGAMSDDFRKSGGGSLSLNKLTIANGGMLYMKYSGDLSIGRDFDGLSLAGVATLYYTNDDSYLTLSANSIIENGQRVMLNIDEISVNSLQSGYYLGIDGAGTADSLAMLKNLLRVDGGQLTNRDWMLEWRDGKLYLIVTRTLTEQNVPWDANWGAREYGLGPKNDELDTYVYAEKDKVQVLSESRYDESDRTLIKITGGGGESSAVIGGYLYNAADAADWLQGNSYIYYTAENADTHYHLLVGGSSSQSRLQTSGGFIGNSHLLLESGSVDYVVGGNRVSGGSFTFRGSSYISLMDGATVDGAIIGGSVVMGAVEHAEVPYAFEGNSYVYLYTVPGNEHASGGEVPKITMGDEAEGVALQAVVGGNALVGANAATLVFRGNSAITLDLSGYGSEERSIVSFEKMLVGGNYVAAGAGSDVYEEGHAWINIVAEKEIVFNTGIAGASRVEGSEGGAESVFRGTSVVSLAGGTYTDKVAGGYWLEDAAGSASLEGRSTVEVHSGLVQAVVAGGSYSSGLSGVLKQSDDSLVIVSGGDFDGATFVGGSFAEDFSGTLSHVGNAKVDLSALANGEMVGTGVVGGDKISFAGGGTAERKGSSSVVIGSGAELEGEVNVVGGSSLSGTGGSVSIDNSGLSFTRSLVGSAGASANPVLLGGSYIGGQSGNLTVETGHTGLQVTDSTVYGTLIGGHGVSSGTGHTVAAGSTHVEVRGGSVIVGSLYGGHYLAQGATIGSVEGKCAFTVSIGALEGSLPSITGDIVGGSYVRSGQVEQGDVTVELTGGMMTGNVYAAGELASASASASTSCTTVVMGESFSFNPAVDTIVSGGYKGAGRGTVDSARLVLTSTATYGAAVSFRDFSVVEVDSSVHATIDSEVGLHVLADSFTKAGAGSLRIEQGLCSADGGAYSGRIAVEQGELLLGAEQSVAGGLSFDLNGRTTNNSSNAYLQAVDGAQLTTAGKGADPIEVELLNDDSLKLGSYYLASGLAEDITVDDFAIDEDWLAEHADGFDAGLKLVNGKLYLRVREVASDKWVWGGANESSVDWVTDDSVWKDDTSANWNVDEATQASNPTGKDVFFTASGADEHDGEIIIEGTVHPNSVHVEGGSYVFMDPESGPFGGLSIGGGTGNDSGHLIVGGAEGYEAELELKLRNTKVDFVDLKKSGTLILSHAEAVNENTKISFQGGILGYGMENGSVIVTDDLSSQVDLASSTDKVKIRVGPLSDDYGVGSVAAASALSGEYAVWGNAKAVRDQKSDSGVYLALSKGLEKYGDYGTLRVEWSETDATMPEVNGAHIATVTGSISVHGGRLEYLAHVANNGRVRLESAEDIFVADGATLSLAVQGTNVALDVRNKFKGKGVVEIGSEDNTGLSFPAMNNAPYLLWGDNSEFEGTIRLMGSGKQSIENIVWASSAAALGGEKTTLSLEGRHLRLNNALESSVLQVAVVQVFGENFLGGYDASVSSSVNSGITLKTGRLEGIGVLANAEARSSTQKFDNVIESDDITGFVGTLVAGGGTAAVTSTWTLRGTRAGADIVDPYTGQVTHGNMFHAVLAGNGRIIFDYAEDVVLTNQVGSATWGTGTVLENAGAGELVLALADASLAQSTGTLVTHADKGAIRLGAVDTANWENHMGYWQGTSLSGDGAFVLTSGVLLNAITDKGSAKLNVATQTILLDDETGELEGTTVDAGGTQGSLFDDIFVNANGLLTNVRGDITLGEGKTSLTLRFGEYNIGVSESPTGDSRAMIELTNGNIDVSDLGSKSAPSFVLDFTEDTFFTILERQIRPDKTTYLYVVDGGELLLSEDKWYDVVCRSGDFLRLLVYLGLEITGTPGGSVQLHGELKDVYLVADGHEEFKPEVEGYGQLSKFKATVVAKDKSLDLTLTGPATADNGADAEEVAAGGAVIHNLVGLENSRLGLHNGSPYAEDQRVTVVLDNQQYVDLDPEEANGLNTAFLGTITSDAGVDIRKTGSGTLTIGSTTGAGGLMAKGDVALAQGMIVIQGGQNNSIAQLVFDYTTAPASGEDRGLRLTNGSKTSIAAIAERSTTARRDSDNKIYLEKGAELTLAGNIGTLASTCITGDGTGSLIIARDSSVAFSNAAAQQLEDVALTIMADGVLDITASNQGRVTMLSGQGKLMGHDESVLTITGGAGAEFSGELAGDGRGAGQGGGTLKVASQGALTLRNVTTTQSSAWSVVSDGDLVIDVSGNKHKTYFQEITLGRGSNTTYILDTDYADCMMSLSGLTVTGAAGLTIETIGHGELNVVNGYVTLAEVGSNTSAATLSELDVELKGVPFLHYEAGDLRIHDKKLQLRVQEVKENRFIMPDMEKNAYAGAKLFWAASSPSSAAWDSMVGNENSDLYMMCTSLAELYFNGSDAELSRTLASGAGASVAVLGSALSHDIERQLSSIRNRTTAMNAEPQHDVYDRAERIYHVWMNGEGSYFKMKADSLAPGYSLSSWGGTVGIDTDVSRETTVGVALTAMYGDLKPQAADAATGNLDTMYLSGFARVANGAWMHTFVVMGGTADVTLNRTVTHTKGSYTTQGDTSGFAFGALYELGYARVMNAEGSFIVQSVFNVELRHAALNGYTERGSDAGLKVDDISHDVVTFGAGARAQAIVGENLYNRTSILEGRMLVKVDAGDRAGTSTHALINGTAEKAEVESAKVGAVGVEIGAGISVPLGSSSGVLFFDASVELRRGYTSLDANAGYRFSF